MCSYVFIVVAVAVSAVENGFAFKFFFVLCECDDVATGLMTAYNEIEHTTTQSSLMKCE